MIDGTNGVAVTPRNRNSSSPNAADATFLNDSGTTIDSITVSGSPISDIQLAIHAHDEIHLDDTLRLGQNIGIALEMDTGDTTPLVFGDLVFFFE